MLMSYKRGQGSIVLRVKILDSTASTGAGKTGLTSASSGLIISTIADNEATATAYTVTGSTIESITTLGTFAAPTATKCRFKEVDSTNHKGVYEIQIADARYAVSSAKSLLISILGATGAAETDCVIPLTDLDPYDTVRAGLTVLPSTACTTNGSLITSGTGTAQISTSSGQVLLQSGTGAGQVKLSSGYVAPNWGDVGNATTTIALTGTTIAITQKVDIDTIKTSSTAATNLGNTYSAFETGTATAGTSSTITLRLGAIATDNYYKDQAIFILSGTGAGQTNRISSYVGATKIATVGTTWAVTPGATSVYLIIGRIG